MFIREDRKSVIFTRNFAFKSGYPKATRFRQNLSHNFNLLRMLRHRRSFDGLNHPVGRDKKVNFKYVYFRKTVSPSFFKKSLVSQAEKEWK